MTEHEPEALAWARRVRAQALTEPPDSEPALGVPEPPHRGQPILDGKPYCASCGSLYRSESQTCSDDFHTPGVPVPREPRPTESEG